MNNNSHLIKHRTLILNFWAAFLAIIGTLFVSEIILQIANFPPNDFSPFARSKETGFKMTPNLKQRMLMFEYDVPFMTNSLGFRDDEIKPKNGFRILMLGDSFLCGYGVRKNEDFAELLKEKLHVDIINSGVIGYDLIHEYQYFRNFGKSLNPDLVVLMLFLSNDLIGNSKWEMSNNALISKENRYPVFIMTRIKILNLIKIFVSSHKIKSLPISEWRPLSEHLEMCRYKLNTHSKENYELSKKFLLGLSEDVKAQGAQLLVVLFSDKTVVENDSTQRYKARFNDFDTTYDLLKPEKEISHFLYDKKIMYYNLNNGMKEYFDRTGIHLYYRLDGHFNKEGHREASELLYPILKKMVH